MEFAFVKKFIRSNLLIIISLSILICWFLFSISNFVNVFYKQKETISILYKECQEEKIQRDCQELKKELDSYVIPPAPLLFVYILASGDIALGSIEYLQITAIIFVFVPAIYPFYKEVKSGIFKSKLSRIEYKKYFKNIYLKSMKAAVILPLFLIISFLITSIVSNFKFQYLPGELEYTGEFFSTREYARSLWIPYLSTMLFAVFAHSIYYINTAYLMFYKAKNFILNSLATYLFYIVTQTVLISSIGMILSRVFKMGEFAITLSDPEIWLFGTDVSRFEYMIYSSLIYILLSTFIVFLVYRKKERFVMVNE